MKNISVVINTKNAENTLERALKSVSWCQDIIIVDMGSSDATKTIASKYTQNIFDFKDVGFVEPARNFAIAKASGEWVLVLDADEEVSSKLASRLPVLTATDVAIYDIPRKNIVFNKWLKYSGWWPDYQRRLFKKGAVTWQEKIHSMPQVKGKIQKIDPNSGLVIIHHNYQTIEQYIDRLNRYTSIEAKQAKDQLANQKTVIEEGFSELFRRYFQNQGYKDNMHGLSVTMLQMFYQIIVKLKVWQEQGFADSSESISQAFPKIVRQMKFWFADYKIKTAKDPLTKIYWQVRKRLSI